MSSVAFSAKPRPAVTAARRDARLLRVDVASGVREITRLSDLPALLRPGDVLVVNDAATLPASLAGRLARTGTNLEARLLAALQAEEGAPAWRLVLLGEGDWRTSTEHRPPPPAVIAGDLLRFAGGLTARVTTVDERSPRVVEVVFAAEGGAFLSALYRAGRPVQYAYHEKPLAIWDHQTLFAAAPVAVEPPSAAMHLTWRLVFALMAQGVQVVSLTHATGLSSTGDEAVDAALPVPERYTIPAATAEATQRARRSGHRVIAVGTGVMRALESAGRTGGVRGGSAVTDLRLSSRTPPTVVSGLLTGLHDEGTSHLELLQSLVSAAELERGYDLALAAEMLWHEFGDVCLILLNSMV
jgi:S-adenosylmethionine:tRNA ribosyltransferase-isomerase